MSLHRTSASALLSTTGISTYTSLGFQCSGGGISTAGQVLGLNTWLSTAAGVQTFDCSNEVYSPTGGSALTSDRYAVIRQSATGTSSGYPLCYAALSTTAFDVGSGSTLTVQMAGTGIFTLT